MLYSRTKRVRKQEKSIKYNTFNYATSLYQTYQKIDINNLNCF